jgi:phage FluMu protein Com
MKQSRNVTMDFACCGCGHAVSVTVTCSGKGLYAAADLVAAVNVPCPTCGQVNQLHFEPSGTVRTVAPYPARRHLPEPSMN